MRYITPKINHSLRIQQRKRHHQNIVTLKFVERGDVAYDFVLTQTSVSPIHSTPGNHKCPVLSRVSTNPEEEALEAFSSAVGPKINKLTARNLQQHKRSLAMASDLVDEDEVGTRLTASSRSAANSVATDDTDFVLRLAN